MVGETRSRLLPMAPTDRRCPAWTLDNRVRRWLAPAAPTLDWLGVREGMTVADIGAGVGYFARAELERVSSSGRLYLIDPDGPNLARALAHVAGHPNAEGITTSAADLRSLPSGSVDRAVLSLVICCLVDKEGALAETWRVLREGGRAYVSYPRRRAPGRRAARSLRVTPPLWDRLVRERPWRVVEDRNGWFVTEHLLEKPVEAHAHHPDRLGTMG